jgi:hypothetical protein
LKLSGDSVRGSVQAAASQVNASLVQIHFSVSIRQNGKDSHFERPDCPEPPGERFMKIGNWLKSVPAALVAAGLAIPNVAYAVSIPLGDSSFEAYAVPAAGYAYANAYRPTSAWVDDLDSPPGYTQDNATSNWLYSAAYGESNATSRRPAPRTGNQAMHGLGNYSAQEAAAVFEAGKTYTFSVYAQGDIDATVGAGSAGSSRVFLYMFDGSQPFSEANSLIFKRYAPDTGDFVNRNPAWTAAESQAAWQQISPATPCHPDRR